MNNIVGDAGPVFLQPRRKAAIHFYYQVLDKLELVTIEFSTKEHAANALRKFSHFAVDGIETILLAKSDHPDDLALVATENFIYAEVVDLESNPLVMSTLEQYKKVFEAPPGVPLVSKLQEYEDWKQQNPDNHLTFEGWLRL